MNYSEILCGRVRHVSLSDAADRNVEARRDLIGARVSQQSREFLRRFAADGSDLRRIVIGQRASELGTWRRENTIDGTVE